MIRTSIVLTCVAAAVGLPSASSAQSPRVERPYRGLFRGGADNARQSLIANGSVGGGYDDNILLDQPGTASVDPRLARSGNLGSANGALTYSVNGSKGSFGASGGANTRYYPDLPEPYVASYGASVGGTVRFAPRSSLSASQSLSYQPYTFTSAFPLFTGLPPGQLPDPALDLATGNQPYLAYNSLVGLSHGLSQRVTFNAAYNLSRSDTAFGGGRFTQQGGNAGFRFGIARGLGFRLGYAYQEGRYSSLSTPARTHSADVGIDFNRALSFSRRTTLSFSTGTTAFTTGAGTTYRMVGGARLNHEMGRTWNAQAAYDRSFQFVDTLVQPIFYDSLSATLGGLFTRRLEFTAGVRAALGTIGFGNQVVSQDFDTFQASTSIGYGLSRFAQLGTSYSFFRYRFDQGALLPPGVARNIDRQSVRVYLSLWAPLINRARR